MTIKQFKSAFADSEMADFALDVIDVWSNDAVKGYLLIACKAQGMAEEQIEGLMGSLDAAFASTTVDYARDYYKYYEESEVFAV